MQWRAAGSTAGHISRSSPEHAPVQFCSRKKLTRRQEHRDSSRQARKLGRGAAALHCLQQQDNGADRRESRAF